MTDIIIPKKLRLIDSREMHGHIRLDIHNTRSGFTERIEQDNLVTDAANEFMWRNALCAFHGDSCKNNISLWGGIFGGVYLFKDTINTSGNMLPFGANRVIGYAGGSTDVQGNRGYYNAAESSFNDSEGVCRTVWDWGTAQANGQIGSVARTMDDTGIGYFGRRRYNSYLLFSGLPQNATDSDTYRYMPIGIDKANGIIYYYRSSNGKYYKGPYSVALSNNTGIINSRIPRDESQLEEICNARGTGYYRENHWVDIANGKIYQAGVTQYGSNQDGIVRLWVVDIATNSYTDTNVTLTGCHINSDYVAFSDGYMYLCGYDPNDSTKFGIYQIELADMTNVNFYCTSDEVISRGYTSPQMPFYLAPWGVSGVSFSVGYVTGGTSYYKEMLMDQDGHFYFGEPCFTSNTQSSSSRSQMKIAYYCGALGPGVDEEPVSFYKPSYDSYSLYSYCYLYNAADYMATVANLVTPVTKTSSETLKLTYTLSDN